jgi:GH35 family endo-1,4-beta-xylanase
LFLNDYNTIEDSRDGLSTPSRYIQKIRQIQSSSRHFSSSPPNLPYMRASLDTLRSASFPIWITELDVTSQPNQVKLITSMNFFIYYYTFMHQLILVFEL